jgi:CheY-like chemotaxis protein
MEERNESVLTGVMTVLVCGPDPELREKIGAALKTGGYDATFSETAADAVGVLRLRLFDVVVVDESFDETLRYLAAQNMSTRRRFFVALTGRNVTTKDNMTAFNQSVNIVINASDVNDIAGIIKQGVAENADFYRVFNDTLRQAGRI